MYPQCNAALLLMETDMTKFNLTANEERAALILVLECLAGMGGDRPSDLADDEYTWCDAKTLMSHGYSAAEATGTFGALKAKGFVEDYDRNEWVVATEGWQYIDTIWDASEFGKPAETAEATYLDLYNIAA